VAELTGLLRESAGGDRLAGRPVDMRILVPREKIDEGTQAIVVRADQRLSLPGDRHQHCRRAGPAFEARH
jgi:hypothetical protein